MVRVLKFIPGKILFELSPWTTKLFVQAGEFCAKFDEALKVFFQINFSICETDKKISV